MIDDHVDDEVAAEAARELIKARIPIETLLGRLALDLVAGVQLVLRRIGEPQRLELVASHCALKWAPMTRSQFRKRILSGPRGALHTTANTRSHGRRHARVTPAGWNARY